jgi:AraC family transcriptional regulator, positive regulator of tynA and feaB
MAPEGAMNSETTLAYEAWQILLRAHCGRYSLGGVQPEPFAGTIQATNLCGFAAVNLTCNIDRAERTPRDIRSDYIDYYKVVFQLAGNSAVTQNDRVTELAVGDVALVDLSRPSTYSIENRLGRWLGLCLPRRSVTSHLGFEPEGGLCWRAGTSLAARSLFRLVLDASNEVDPSPVSAEVYMQLAVYDLLGALFAVSEFLTTSSYADKVFERVCRIIKGRFADPEVGPYEVALEAGISLRYLQKLFTERGSTCSHFIQSLRLDHAARLLHRRSLIKTKQPLSEIAYACGFRDYNHFAQTFRYRFGCPPSAFEGHI